jgi:hypothetical protein
MGQADRKTPDDPQVRALPRGKTPPAIERSVFNFIQTAIGNRQSAIGNRQSAIGHKRHQRWASGDGLAIPGPATRRVGALVFLTKLS